VLVNTSYAQSPVPAVASDTPFERVPGRRKVLLTLTVTLLVFIAWGAGRWWRQFQVQRREALQELVESDSRRIGALNAQISAQQEAYDVVENKARNLNMYDWEIQSRLLTQTRTIIYGERVQALEQDNAIRLERIHQLRQQLVVLTAELRGARAELEEK
jgi:hypothetical protein